MGWTPEQTLDTPIPQIMLAAEGRMDFAVRTNPFGGAPKAKKATKKPTKTIEQQRAAILRIRLDAREKHRAKRCQTPQKDS